jgi:fatty-acyl-CoA synthase
MSFTLQRLASYKKPRHIFFMDGFPIRNETKVDKAELARMCSAMLASNLAGA